MEPTKINDILTLSLSGKPHLKEVLEKKLNAINKERANPMKANDFIYELLDIALRNYK